MHKPSAVACPNHNALPVSATLASHDGPATTRPFVAVPLSGSPEYVYAEAGSLRQFVNRYIRTRRRPVNRENRFAVQQAIESYDGRFPARCRDLESFLDSLLLERPSAA